MKHQKVRHTFVALGIALRSTLPARAAVVNAGNVTGATITTNSSSGNVEISFALSNGGSVEVSPYAPDLIRVNYHWTGPFDTAQPMIAKPADQWSATPATLTDQGTKYLLQTSELDVEIEKTPLKIHFKSKSGFYLLQDDFMERDADYYYNGQRGTGSSKLKCRKIMPANQAIFGLGEYGGPMNRRGKEIDCWNSGTYNWGEFTNPTYMNIPFFYGLQPAEGGNPAFVYGLFLNNPCRPLFKFGTESGDRYSFQAGDGRMDYFFFGGGASHGMAEVIDRYSELTGRPTFLPKWGLGYHLSRFSYNNQSWVEYIANEAGNTDIPLDAVYLDIDYMDATPEDNNFADGNLRQLTMNSNFPNPAGMISYCNDRGVKVVPLIEPWLQPSDPLHGEAAGLLHFIKDNAGNTVTRGIYVGNVSWFDYSSTPMQTWWQGKIVNWLNSVGFAGIWNDLTEPEGGDSIPHDGLLWIDGQFGTSNTDSRRFWSNERNYFGLRCAKQSYDTMTAKNPNLRPFVLSRSGNAGLQRYAVSWSGDTRADWFYHRATIRFGMGAMIAGAAWYGNDVGGFVGTPSDELMVRSTEANALTPFFRNHCDKSAANREPWRFDSGPQGLMRDIIKFRYRLMPYFYTLAYEATQTGEPVNVPPAFDYYADANTHNLSDYEYLVGDYLLAAPVYDQGATTRYVYLPYKAGINWYYWHSNAKYGRGQTVQVDAPLGTLPLFVRSGAIIPMGPSMQHANEYQSPWMDINCWPEGDSEFTLFEDDGESWDYQNGAYSKRRMVSSRTEAYWDFTIEAKQGTYATGARDFYVYCYNPGTDTVQGVTLNGAPLPQLADFGDGPQGWRITNEGRIGVKVPDNGAVAALRISFADIGDTIQFTATGYSSSETSTSVRVFASRTGSATGSVSVSYATADGSATAGSDYTATTGTLTWAGGDLANKFFDVSLIDDPQYEGNESFTVSLSSPAGASLGSPATATVTLLENDPVPPDLVITNPAMNLTVDTGTSNITVQGTANATAWTGLVWSNANTGASGIAPISATWTLDSILLGFGTNLITVTATNVGGPLAEDSGADPLYADGWSTNDNGGVGFGAWTAFTSSEDGSRNGRFIAESASVDIGTPAWGLYANSNNTSEVKRQLPGALAIGQTFHVSMDNGFLDPGAGTGVALQNAAGVTLWEFYFNGGDTNYSISEGITDIGWTAGGLDVSVALSSPTSYVAVITPYGGNTRTNTGNLIAAADQDITLFRAWNYNAGEGSDYDFFFNNLSVEGGAGVSTSASVVIVRPAINSEIPLEWRNRYNLTGTDQEDSDGDTLTDLEEYWADTVPTNGASFFGKVSVNDTLGTAGTVMVKIAAPTTNSRIYGLSWATNLVSGSWSNLNGSLPGQNDGSDLIFIVTNAPESEVFYRGRVGLPQVP
ncbi:MAG: DUF5110 domain-containing protein [Kiritimatiellae bacterium]|nr:DUF5110 domain-containing protein [Kiritimatiellia bacterium]